LRPFHCDAHWAAWKIPTPLEKPWGLRASPDAMKGAARFE
jgi:hypothetical protein